MNDSSGVCLISQAAFLALKQCCFHLPLGDFKCRAFKVITLIFQNSVIADQMLCFYKLLWSELQNNKGLGYLRQIKHFFFTADQLK